MRVRGSRLTAAFLLLGLIVALCGKSVYGAESAWYALPGIEDPELRALCDELTETDGMFITYMTLPEERWQEIESTLRSKWREQPSALAGCLLGYSLFRIAGASEDDEFRAAGYEEIQGLSAIAGNLAPESPIPLHLQAVARTWEPESKTEMLRLARSALELDPNFLPARLLPLHCAMYVDPDLELAVLTADQLLEEYPQNSFIHHLRGVIYKLTDDMDAAVSEWQLSMELDPHHKLSRIELFNTAFDKADYETAVIYAPLLEEMYSSWNFYYLYSFCLEQLDRYEEAWRVLQQGLVLNPDEVELNYHAAYQLRKLSRQKEALRYSAKALAKDAGHRYSLYEAGRSRMDLQQYSQAIPFLKRAVEAEPNYYSALFDLASCQVNLEMFAESIPGFKRCIVLSPESPEPYYNMGIVYWNVGNIEEALKYANQSLKLSPADSEIQHLCEKMISSLNELKGN